MSLKSRLAPAGLTLFLLLTQPAVAQPADDARAWLDRLAGSAATLSYQGVVAYAEGSDQLHSLRITHGQAGGELYERLEYLNDAHREVVLHGGQLTSSSGGRQLARALPSRQLTLGGDRIAAHYDGVVVGEGRVAERPTVELALTPRDGFRLGYRLSLDRETGLLLRSETIDPERGVLERFQFATIDISGQLKDEWLAGVRPASAVAAAGENAEAGTAGSGWQPGWLPPGFELTAGSQGEREMLTYSDGLAVLSVIIQPLDGAQPPAGKARRGATVAYTRGAAFDGRNYAITVIGEVPLAAAQRVAESVAPTPPARS